MCSGKLQSLPKHVTEPSQVPEGCGFHCRDNMTDVCARMAALDGCTTHAAVMRKQCPETCGVCKALGMRVSTVADYAKPVCEDVEEHKTSCPGWAASGECVKNHGFMAVSCGKSCGLCGAAPAATSTASGGGAKKKCKKGKKGAKCRKERAKAAAAAAAAAAGGADAAATPAGAAAEEEEEEEEEPAAEAEEPAAAEEEEKVAASGGGGSIPSEPTEEATPAAPVSESAPSEAKKEKEKGGGFMSGVKKAMGKVGDAIKGKKGGKEEPKAEL